MAGRFIEIEESLYEQLQTVANGCGFESVDEFLEEFATKFSSGCSVTIGRSSDRLKKDRAA